MSLLCVKDTFQVCTDYTLRLTLRLMNKSFKTVLIKWSKVNSATIGEYGLDRLVCRANVNGWESDGIRGKKLLIKYFKVEENEGIRNHIHVGTIVIAFSIFLSIVICWHMCDGVAFSYIHDLIPLKCFFHVCGLCAQVVSFIWKHISTSPFASIERGMEGMALRFDYASHHQFKARSCSPFSVFCQLFDLTSRMCRFKVVSRL